MYNDLYQRLSDRYKKHLWSATSKLLWVRFGSPYRLWDQFADKFMRKLSYKITAEGNDWYRYYCDAWRTKYDKYRSEIIEACTELIVVRKFFATKEGDIDQIESELNKPSFHERVFDHFISWSGD